jgi:hypothetical protein
MLRRALLALAPVLLCASAPAKKKDEEEAAPAGPWVDLAPVALPVIVDGRLVNYVFVYVRINFTRSANVFRLREKEPYFRDALIRSGHRTPFTLANDYTHLDAARLAASLKRDAIAITSAKDIASVSVLRQTAKRRTGLPRPTPRPS